MSAAIPNTGYAHIIIFGETYLSKHRRHSSDYCAYYLAKPILTHLCLASHWADIGKQWDPDQTPHDAASDQGLHCLHEIQEFLKYIVTIKTNQIRLILKRAGPKIQGKRVHSVEECTFYQLVYARSNRGPVFQIIMGHWYTWHFSWMHIICAVCIVNFSYHQMTI